MKKIIILAIFTSLFLIFLTNKAQAIPIFYSWGGDKINTVNDLPNDSTTMSQDGYYINIGCIYKQFSIFWIPIWNWDESYCLEYEGADDMYGGKITKEQAEEIAAEFNVKLGAATPSLWNKIGGKGIILLVLAFIIWGSIGKNKEEEDEISPADTE